MRPDIHRRPAKATVKAKRRKRSLIHHFGDSLAKRDGGFHCHYCLVPLVRADPHKPNAREDWRRRGKGIATVDHKMPTSKGGSSKLENLVLSCYDCNVSKGDSTYEIFIRSLKYAEAIKSSNKPNQPYRRRG